MSPCDGARIKMQTASTSPKINFPFKLRLRVPQGLPEALQLAAQKNFTTSAEWSRQALIKQLAAEGVPLSRDDQS